MLATFANGSVTFKTGHLSEYVISTIKLTDTGVQNGDDSSSAPAQNPDNGEANTGNADQETANNTGNNGGDNGNNTGNTGNTSSGKTDDKNVATGIAFAFVPAIAAAAAVVISKKRK